jgi:DNA-binding NarL/FixJ family response regulator
MIEMQHLLSERLKSQGGGAMEKKTTYFLIDEQTMFRDCLRFMLENEESFSWIGEAEDGIEAVSKIKLCRPDLVLMELALPKFNGFSVIKEIKNHSPNTHIIVLSANDSDENILEAFKRGARAYCLKDINFTELLLAIDKDTGGRIYLSPEIAAKVLSGYLNNNKRQKSKNSWEAFTMGAEEAAISS